MDNRNAKRMKRWVALLFAALMTLQVGMSIPTFAMETAAVARPKIESLIWKRVTSDLTAGMTYDLKDVYDFRILPLDNEITFESLEPVTQRIADTGVDDTDIAALLKSAVSSVGNDLTKMDGLDLLALSEQDQAAILNAFFAALKAKYYVDVDTLVVRRLIPNRTILYWALRTYAVGTLVTLSCEPESFAVIDNDAQTIRLKRLYSDQESELLHLTLSAKDAASACEPITYGLKFWYSPVVKYDLSLAWTKTQPYIYAETLYNLSDLYAFALSPLDASLPIAALEPLAARVAEKGLDRTAMISLLHAAVASAGSAYRSFTAMQLLELPEQDIANISGHIFAGLQALGVSVDTRSMAVPARSVVYWMLRTYDTSALVTLACPTANAAVIDNQQQTIRINPISGDRAFIRLVLSSAGSDVRCTPIKTDVLVIRPPKLSETKVRLRYKQNVQIVSSKAVTWSSSDDSVAEINQKGVITARGKGTAVVTAVTEDGLWHGDCIVEVRYAWWQMLIRIFLLGFLWY